MKRVAMGLALALAASSAFAGHANTINKTGFVGVNKTQSAQSLGHSKLVFTALGDKEDKAYVIEFGDGDDNYAEDNWIYVGNEAISEWTLMPGSDVENKTFAISFDTASSGAITIYLPSSIKFTELPTFGNNEHWEIAVRKGYGVYTKYNLV
jgi:hypothetical protein